VCQLITEMLALRQKYCGSTASNQVLARGERVTPGTIPDTGGPLPPRSAHTFQMVDGVMQVRERPASPLYCVSRSLVAQLSLG
jgi:hypothetical protein